MILGWKDFNTLSVTFSPYNAIAYEVTLAAGFGEIWQPLKIGHVFDWEHHEIEFPIKWTLARIRTRPEPEHRHLN